MTYIPPFQITSKILSVSQQIARELGKLSSTSLYVGPIKLRRENSIKTIQASLAIEGNTMSLEQVTAILEGKKVAGPQKDIIEVQNASLLYRDLKSFDPLSSEDILRAHKILMNNLIENPGSWRHGNVGVFNGDKVAHIAPQAKRVPELMHSLFKFVQDKSEIPWIIRACIFHYELEFIHPFEDGNGRIGRLWQQLLLMKEDRIFEFLTVESLIKENQNRYYEVLGACDQSGDSTEFIEFSLEIILETLISYGDSAQKISLSVDDRLFIAREKLGKNTFSRRQYMEVHPNLSTASASRDLAYGVQEKILHKDGDKNQAEYFFLG